jgi:hypothetical protein
MLMRPEYRKDIAEAYKKKIESIVRKPAKTEEVLAKCLSVYMLVCVSRACTCTCACTCCEWARSGGLVLHDTPLTARHAARQDEGVSACPYCGIKSPNSQLDCPQCKSRVPYCIATGAPMLCCHSCNCGMQHRNVELA